MKRITLVLAAFALLLCACSPKVSGNVSSESIPAVHPDYAVIYLYRTGNFVQTPYDVHLGDKVVYRSRNKSKTETREGLTLDIEMGKSEWNSIC